MNATGRLAGKKAPINASGAMRHCVALATVAAIAALAVTGNAVVAAGLNTAANPVPGTWPTAKQWRQRHADFVADAKKGGVDLLFLGDSITDFWRRSPTDTVDKVLPEGGGKTVWEKNFAPPGTMYSWSAANFGSCGECTQHVLWRVQNSDLDAIHPKVVVLLIGVNNLALMGDSSEEVADGIKAIVQQLRHKLPAAKLLVLGLFPHANPPLMARIKQVNLLLVKLDDGGKTVTFMDIGDKFLKADKTLKSVMPDGCHPNAKGYQIWADAIMPTVHEIMKEQKMPEEMRQKDQWVKAHLFGPQAKLPFSFVYGGQPFDLLVDWQKKAETKRLDANRTQHTFTWNDPKTSLEVRCVAVDYSDFPALEWTVYFKNAGKANAPRRNQQIGIG